MWRHGALGLFIACQTPIDGAGPSGLEAPGTATVDATGGSIELEGGGWAQVPAGAVSTAVTLEMRPGAPADVPGVPELGVTWSFEPSGTTFAVPIDVYLPMPPGAEGDLALAISEDGAEWELLPTRSAPLSGTVHASVPHFSVAVLVPANGPLPCAAISCLSDGDPCTADACDPLTGTCWEPEPAGTSCEEDACTVGHTCQAGGQCTGFVPTCDDGDACTWDACDPATGCVSTPGAAEVFASAAQGLVAPHELAWGPEGRLWVADPGADRVWVFSIEGDLEDWVEAPAPRTLLFLSDGDLLVGGGSWPAVEAVTRFTASSGYTESRPFVLDTLGWTLEAQSDGYYYHYVHGFQVTSLAEVTHWTGDHFVVVGAVVRRDSQVQGSPLLSPRTTAGMFRFDLSGANPMWLWQPFGVPEALYPW